MAGHSRTGGVRAVLVAAGAVAVAVGGPAAAIAQGGGRTEEAAMVAQEADPAPEITAGHAADGRRDPFVRPVAPGAAAPGEERPGGLSGLAVDEVILRGVVGDRRGRAALVEAPDGRTYAVRPGDRLYDGTVQEIAADAVLFRRDAGPVPGGERQVRKRLRAGEGAR